jgi:hypothetical protein
MKLLNRLAYTDTHRTLAVPGGSVRARPHQIIVWVSVNLANVLEWDDRLTAFPAILDTGNNFTFSLHHDHLVQWAGIRPELLRLMGSIRDKGVRANCHEAILWLHPNVPKTSDRNPEREPFRLKLEPGLAVYPPGPPSHLPLLGLRALTQNRLHAAIDGDRREVTVRTPKKWWLF